MELTIRPVTPEEQPYLYSRDIDVDARAGCVGHLRGDFDRGGESFFTTWFDHRSYLNEAEFKAEFDEVINTLRKDMLSNRAGMRRYCRENGGEEIAVGTYGFRVDSAEHSYLVRCFPSQGNYEFYVYAYKTDLLDKHMNNASRQNRFIDSSYNELFRVPDGGNIVITYSDGSRTSARCEYIDDYHFSLNGECYHICQFAETLEKNGASCAPEDPADPVLPLQCYSTLPSTGELILIYRGKDGYSPCGASTDDPKENLRMAEVRNTRHGVSKAKEAAMVAGSMFGWNVPAADPKNYDSNGNPMPIRGNRFDALSERYEEITVLDKSALFTSGRIERSTVPDGLYMYEVRHDDDGNGDPVQIGKGIAVNHWGTILTREPIQLPPDGLLDIDPQKDWAYSTGDCRTVKEFMDKYQPEKPPRQKPGGAR